MLQQCSDCQAFASACILGEVFAWRLLRLNTPDLALQAILAESSEREGLDVELAASGFGQQHQQVWSVTVAFPQVVDIILLGKEVL